MIDAWWLVLVAAVCFIAGIAVTLTAAAFLVKSPMDGRTYTGDLGTLQDDP